MINNVVLVGRLTKEIQLKKVGKDGLSTCSFTLAVNQKFGKKEADFINCVAWRTQADFLNSYCQKGDLIGVTGRISTRNYEKDNGEKVFITEVVCDSVESYTRREEKSEVVYRKDIDANEKFQQETLTGSDRGVDGFKEIEIEPDNLPFY